MAKSPVVKRPMPTPAPKKSLRPPEPLLPEVVEIGEEEKPIITNAIAVPARSGYTREVKPSRAEDAVRASAGTLKTVEPREGADVLHVDSLRMFEKIMCNGVLAPWALLISEDVAKLITRLREAVK